MKGGQIVRIDQNGYEIASPPTMPTNTDRNESSLRRVRCPRGMMRFIRARWSRIDSDVSAQITSRRRTSRWHFEQTVALTDRSGLQRALRIHPLTWVAPPQPTCTYERNSSGCG